MNKELIALAQELLVDTASHYNSGNRAESDSGCLYLMDDGRRCAAGRMMTDEGAKTASSHSNKGLYKLRDDIGREAFLALFQEKWRPLLEDENGSLMVRSVQNLHDMDNNWSPDGLSPKGLGIVERIIEEYGMSLDTMKNIQSQKKEQ